jgi:predicted 3-demethylubiquinone-9 3-methyltransferase (glyoxalase superfamily)
MKSSNNQLISNCLWFDKQGQQAAEFYVSVFPDSSIGEITYYSNVGQETHGQPAGTVMTVIFNLDGQEFMALNGGPHFKFNEAMSLMIACNNQEEVDYYWNQLTADGGEEGPCGWLKDKFGVSWQVNPVILNEMLRDPDKSKVERVTEAFLKMKKFDIAKLQQAFDGR